mgnify:CR=1 FL=1
MKTMFAILLTMTCCLTIVAQNADELFRQGNRQYEDRDFAGALETYRQAEQVLAAEGRQSADLYFNMGCAAFRIEDPAEARYWLEKARRLEPGNRNILHNLAVLKQSLSDRVKDVPGGALEHAWRVLVNGMPYQLLAYLVLFLLLTVFAFAGWLIAGRRNPKPLYYGLGFSLFLLLVTGLMLNSRAGDMTRPEAVVTAAEVEIFSEPNTSSSLLFRLHAGTLVNVEDHHSGFLHVSLPDGMNGWARRQDFRSLN